MSAAPARAAAVVIVAATLLRLAIASVTDLGLDESYALAVSRQFQLSWFDHPPMVFWITGAMQAILGAAAPPSVLRLPFIALSAGTSWLLFVLAARHYGGWAGFWTVLLFSTAPFFLLSAGSWLVPDGPLCFFLALASVALSEIVFGASDKPHWRPWLGFGIALGLAMLSKYHAIPFAAGALLYLLSAPERRRWFARPQPYVAALLAAALFLPVVIWNAQNEWASFAFQLGRGEAGPSNPQRILTIYGFEAAYLLVTTALLLLAAIVMAIRRRTGGFFLLLGVPIVAVGELPRFWTWDSFAHWPMPGWMLLLPLAGAMIAGWRPVTRTIVGALSLLQIAGALVAVVLLVSNYRLRLPDLDGFLFEAASWTGVAEGLRAAGVLQETPRLIVTSWRDGARLAEALREPLPVLSFEASPHGFAWSGAPSSYVGHDALLFVRDWDRERALAAFAPYFDALEDVGRYPVQPGSSSVIDVVRGRVMRKALPMPYGNR